MGYLCLSVSSPGQTFIENVHFTKTVVTIRVSEPACYVAATAPIIFSLSWLKKQKQIYVLRSLPEVTAPAPVKKTGSKTLPVNYYILNDIRDAPDIWLAGYRYLVG